ncbi:unnamed protein product [Meloidogyne enterolobii]|uniref:Uncharacterized protein n=1 Tax=Meloidogyne enterolobii TaxID=390850 RepID=A0ACB1A3V6_MELEN
MTRDYLKQPDHIFLNFYFKLTLLPFTSQICFFESIIALSSSPSLFYLKALFSLYEFSPTNPSHFLFTLVQIGLILLDLINLYVFCK